MSLAANATGIGAAIWLALAATGAGRALLAAVGARFDGAAERLAFEFSFGVGILGWAAFFFGVAGLLSWGWLLALTAAGAAGFLTGRRPAANGLQRTADAADKWIVLLIVALVVVGLFDVAQALSPPADADSLAYHFAQPKHFLNVGRIVFTPRAVDGSSPMLLTMTYMLALGLGGEVGMTVWVALLSWGAVLLLYAVARKYLDRRWALILTAVFATTPAVVYGEGSGQLEVKLILFSVTAALCTAAALRTGALRYAVLAGIACGFFAGSKYFGVVFLPVCGIALLCQRRWLAHGAVFGIAALVAGSQWYVWNFIHAGDPVFPLLYEFLGAKHGYWSAQADAYLHRTYFPEESPVPTGLWLLISYPFRATLDSLTIWDAGRTGMGPYGLLLLPLALAGGWRYRDRIRKHPLSVPVAISIAFYAIWSLSGTSQRIRHLLPIYPIFLICLTLAALRFATARKAIAPLAAACIVTLGIQMGGATVFAANYLRFQFTGESREHFLMRNVARYGPVPWINAHLTQHDRILITERQLTYYLDVPYYGGFLRVQNLVDLRPGESNPKKFLQQIRRLGITHVLMAPSLADFAKGVRHIWTGELGHYLLALAADGCAKTVHTGRMLAPRSRTVPGLGENTVSADVVAIAPSCPALETGK